MRKALYNPGFGIPPMELFVLAENPDGTLELGSDEKTLKIGKCVVSSDNAIGTCAPIESRPENQDQKDKSKK